MKNLSKLLAAAAILLTVVPIAHAQADFGIRAGMNVATIGGADVEDSEARLGLLAGAYGDFRLTPALSIQPELLFSQRGANFDDGVDTGSWAITYLDIPLLLKYNIPTATNLRPSVYAGPQVGLKLSEEVRVEGQVADLDAVRGTDFGITMGADIGAQIAGQRQQFGVGLRYTLGLSNVFDPEAFAGTGETLPTVDARNRVFSVTAYYTF